MTKRGDDRFDAILASVPVGATAGRVTAKGEHWTPEKAVPYFHPHWSAPPPMRAYSAEIDTTSDLTGTKVGRFTAIGILVDKTGGVWRGKRWVVRCACGNYEARATKAISRQMAPGYIANPQEDRCHQCSQLLIAQRRYEKNGSKPLSSFTNARTVHKAEITIKLTVREDGGLHICSDDVLGLILSGSDAQDVMSRIVPALKALNVWPSISTSKCGGGET